MEEADVLYGVTMQDEGVSKLLAAAGTAKSQQKLGMNRTSKFGKEVSTEWACFDKIKEGLKKTRDSIIAADGRHAPLLHKDR